MGRPIRFTIQRSEKVDRERALAAFKLLFVHNAESTLERSLKDPVGYKAPCAFLGDEELFLDFVVALKDTGFSLEVNKEDV